MSFPWNFILASAIVAFLLMNGAVSDETTSKTDTASPHGSNCTENGNCDQTIGLSCIGGKCECGRPTEMIYDQNQTACIVLQSFACDKTPNLKSETFQCTKNAACVSKSNSTNDNQTKLCTCNSGYSATGTQRCLADFNTNCDLENELCNSDANLMCHVATGEKIGNCGCYTPKEDIYENGRCITLVGGNCTRNTAPYILECVKNAFCHLKNNTETKNTTGICECNEGLTTEKGRCVKNSVSSIVNNVFMTVTFVVLVIEYVKLSN